MDRNKLTPILICIVFSLHVTQSFTQERKIEPFGKLKVRGAVLVNYHVTKEPGIQIIDSQNEHLIKTKIKNNKLTIKHLKIKPNQNKQVEINLYGHPLKEIVATQAALIKSDSVILSDTAAVCLASGAELRATVQSKELSMSLSSGSFGYLEGEVKFLKLKAKTGARFRAYKATVIQTVIKVSTGAFAALRGDIQIEGKVITGGELKFYGKIDDSNIKRHTHGIVSQSDDDEL